MPLWAGFEGIALSFGLTISSFLLVTLFLAAAVLPGRPERGLPPYPPGAGRRSGSGLSLSVLWALFRSLQPGKERGL